MGAETVDPVAARSDLARWFLERLEADVVLYQRFVNGPRGPVHTSIHLEGLPRFEQLLNCEGEIANDLPERLHPANVDRALRNRLRVWRLHGEDEPGISAARFQQVFRPAGFSDQARMIGFEGSRHVGYISALYVDGRRFARERLSELIELEPTVREGLVRVDALHRAVSLPSRLLLSPDGEVMFGDATFSDGDLIYRFLEWSQSFVRELRVSPATHVSCVFEGFSVDFTRVSGRAGQAWWVETKALPPVMLDELAPLTERQREVARLAAEALTTSEISEELGLSPNTVKSHLKKIYDILGVSSRVELIRRIQPDQVWG